MRKRLTLIPAIRKNGVIHPGKEGGEHVDIVKAKKLGLKAKDNEYGFLTPNDKFLTRDKAIDWLSKNKPAVYKSLQERGINELRSRDLIDDSKSGKATKETEVKRKSKKEKMIEEDL